MKIKMLMCALTLATLPVAALAADECGEVNVAEFSWQSAEAIANIDKFILENGYGCTVSILAGDTVPTITSMVETGQPDIIPEAATELLPDVTARGLKEGRVIAIGHSITEGALEGWYIPKYFADAHPDIKTVADALKHPDLFPTSDDPSKGGILMGPQGWGGTVVTGQLFKAFKGEEAGFVLIDTGSAAGLDSAISRAYEQKQNFITYYWSPTSLMAKYPLVRLDGGVSRDNAEWTRCTTVESCTDPKPNYWVATPYYTLITQAFEGRPGTELARSYLKARAWNTDTVSQLMVWMTENQGSGVDGARHFLETQEDVWTKWVPAEVATKVKAAL